MINSKQHRKHKRALLVSFLVVAILLGGVFVFGSMVYEDYIDAEVDRLAVAADLAKEDSLLELKDLAVEAIANKELITGFVITEDVLPRFVDLIEEVGQKKGAVATVVSLAELGSIEKGSKGGASGWRLELRLEGSFNQVWQGLKLVEAMPVAKKITKVNLIRTSAPTDNTAVRWAGGVEIELPTIK